jgi:hypothetical protein
MSLSMRLTRSLLRFRPVSTKSAESVRDRVAHRKPSAPVSPGLRRVAHAEETIVNGCPVIQLTPKSGAGGAHLVYHYGGAYISPMLSVHWTIITMGRDGLLEAGRWWAGDHDVRSPLVSPIFGDLAKLPPVHIYQGAWDLFAADAQDVTDKIRAAGGEAHLHLYPDAFHVFVGAPWTPEARAALRDISSLLRGSPR